MSVSKKYSSSVFDILRQFVLINSPLLLGTCNKNVWVDFGVVAPFSGKEYIEYKDRFEV